ncbi:MAG: preprotein translocase subunit SecE [Candidatus Kaiserbacteria bacterium]|nr:preprotein translocase subunit SecE [Candidatus Kaiserbacteria bacterium]
MAGFGQYLKETRGELRHVAWPTRTQTIVYTILVAAISVGVALYLGLFDYVFTSALSKTLGVLPSAPTQTQTQATTTAPQNGSSTPVNFKI